MKHSESDTDLLFSNRESKIRKKKDRDRTFEEKETRVERIELVIASGHRETSLEWKNIERLLPRFQPHLM